MKFKELKIVEVERQLGIPDLDATSAPAVATLREHPGFQYLLAKLRLQASLLRTTLANTKHKDLNEVEFLQSGIAWCNWLQQQLEKSIGLVNRPVPRAVRPSEIEAFEALQSQIQWIGAANRPNGLGDNTKLTAPQAQGE